MAQKKKQTNDGIGKVIGDIQEKFSQFKEDLEEDVREFNDKVKEHWESLASKFDAGDVRKERDHLVSDLNKRADKFVKKIQLKLPGVQNLQQDLDRMKRRMTKLEEGFKALARAEPAAREGARRKSPPARRRKAAPTAD